MSIQRRSKKDQRIAAELGEIIDEMGRAMWSANRRYIAKTVTMGIPLTFHMESVLYRFKAFCEAHCE